METLRLRLNNLLRAYFYGNTIAKGQPMSREEIIAELRAIKARLEQEQEKTIEQK